MIDYKENSPLCLNYRQNRGWAKGKPNDSLGFKGVDNNYLRMKIREYEESLWNFEEKKLALAKERPLGREEKRLLESVRQAAERNRPSMAQILTA